MDLFKDFRRFVKECPGHEKVVRMYEKGFVGLWDAIRMIHEISIEQKGLKNNSTLR